MSFERSSIISSANLHQHDTITNFSNFLRLLFFFEEYISECTKKLTFEILVEHLLMKRENGFLDIMTENYFLMF